MNMLHTINVDTETEIVTVGDSSEISHHIGFENVESALKYISEKTIDAEKDESIVVFEATIKLVK